MTRDEAIIKKHTEDGYKYGFTTDIDQERAEVGLNEDTIRYISAKKNEPKWLLDWRLKAFDVWKKWIVQIGLISISLPSIINPSVTMLAPRKSNTTASMRLTQRFSRPMKNLVFL